MIMVRKHRSLKIYIFNTSIENIKHIEQQTTCLAPVYPLVTKDQEIYTYIHMGYARGILIGSMVQYNVYRGAMAS